MSSSVLRTYIQYEVDLKGRSRGSTLCVQSLSGVHRTWTRAFGDARVEDVR